MDGVNPIHDRECIGKLTRKPTSYDPLKGSSREYVWTDEANCSEADPELFQVASQGDPIAGGRKNGGLTKFNRERAERAASYCEGCPVRQTCLQEATASDRYWSVRGGELPVRLAGTRVAKAYVPTSENSEYEEPWSCAEHGRIYKKSYVRKMRGKEYTRVYCSECSTS